MAELGVGSVVLLDLGERELVTSTLALELSDDRLRLLDDLGILVCPRFVAAGPELGLGVGCERLDLEDVECSAGRGHPVKGNAGIGGARGIAGRSGNRQTGSVSRPCAGTARLRAGAGYADDCGAGASQSA